MSKAKLYWAHDLLAAVFFVAVSGSVFWFLPPALPVEIALKDPSISRFSHTKGHATCSAVIS